MTTSSTPELPELSTLEVSIQDSVATITLNRPEQLNAISFEMAAELRTVVTTLGWHRSIKVMVFKGSGRAFCAGYDVTTQRSMSSPRERMVDAERLSSVLELIARAPVVRIAQLHGHVIGAGMALALQCHMRYAAENTRFSLPEVNFGIPFLLGGASLLTRELGPVRTADMILNCTVLPVQHPDASRLVTEVLRLEELETKVQDVANKLGARPEALLMATLSTIERANHDLLPPAPSDMFHGFFVRDDAECKQVGADYVQQLKAKSGGS